MKFKLPAVMFSQYIRLNSVLQAVDNLDNHFLEVPEACNIHPSAEVGISYHVHLHIFFEKKGRKEKQFSAIWFW